MLRNLPADFDTKPPSHYQNFIDCVRSRKLTVAHAEAAHRAASFGQLAIVAHGHETTAQVGPESRKSHRQRRPSQTPAPQLAASCLSPGATESVSLNLPTSHSDHS